MAKNKCNISDTYVNCDINWLVQTYIAIFSSCQRCLCQKTYYCCNIHKLKTPHTCGQQHDLYVNNLVGDVKANPRDFYRYINSQKKGTLDIPPLKKKNGKGVAQSDLEKAKEFNGQFTDVFNKNEHTQVLLLDRSAPFMNDTVVSGDGVIKLLKGLNPSKALGPDELHPRVLKELATGLGLVFAIFFSSQLTLVKFQRNGLLQISAPFQEE